MTATRMQPQRPRIIAIEGDLWVVDKPSGWVVHPVGNPDMPELMAWAREEAGAPPAIAPIHRLDRATSGVVLCSADAELRGRIGQWLAERRVEKVYRALAHGRTHKGGRIERPLPDQRRAAPLEAATRFKRLALFAGFSYLEVRPETGRKHQIRRHLNVIGHPIAGDQRYRPTKRRRQLPYWFPPRLWLHALALRLPDGRRFEAPLPAELERHLETLRAG